MAVDSRPIWPLTSNLCFPNLSFQPMSDVVIRVENLGKKYRIRHQRQRYTALRDVIAERTKSVVHGPWSVVRRLSSALRHPAKQKAESRKQKSVEDFWALKD